MIGSRYQKAFIYLLFFLSGSSGLIYEIIWNRKLTLIFGGTVYAVSTILTVFFTGLALGAFLIGRAMDRGRDPISTYVILELLIGSFGLSSPWIFLGIEKIYFYIHPLVDAGLPGLTAIRFVLSFVALLLPTTLMGATLPVLVKLVVKADERVAFGAGRLYAVNTLGAALGTILSAIVLIPLVGVDGSLYLAGTINLTIGIAAFFVLRRASASSVEPPRSAGYRHTGMQKYLLALFCVVGFLSMAYQVAWVRLLIQVTGSTVYTFGLMLSVFIVGVGLGSEIATRLLHRIGSKVLAFALVEVVASAYCLWGTNYFDQLPVLFTHMAIGREGFASFLMIKLVVNLVVLLIPTLMFGAAFPLVAAIYAEKAAISGGDVGLVYSSNTVGGIFGSFVGGFVFLPAFGAQTTITGISVAGLVVAGLIAVTLEGNRQRFGALLSCSLVLVIGAILYRPWDARLINSGPYAHRYADVETLLDSKDRGRLLYFKEGVNVNVSVLGTREPSTIYINGKPQASTLITDVANQYLLGHLPMLLHPDPRSSMVVGLGAGMTFGALALHGSPTDCIEISPEVVGGTRLFHKSNRSVLDQPNANLIFDDGRNYIKTTRKRYDVITEDPLDPFFAGSGYLYDLEHFENAKRALKPGGLMGQYLPLYQVGKTEAQIIAKTFHAVFPHVTAWFAFNDIVLIGSEEPLRIDWENLRRRVSDPEIARDLREIGIDNAHDFLANYLFDESAIEEFGTGLPLNTDDYPIIEYMTPRAVVRQTEGQNVAFFLSRRAKSFPDIVDLGASSPGEVEEFKAIQAAYYEARRHVMEVHMRRFYGGGGIGAEIVAAEQLVSPRTTASYYLAYVFHSAGTMSLGQKNFRQALGFLEKAYSYRANSPQIMSSLALALLRNGERRRSLDLFEKSLRMDENQVLPRIHIADELVDRNELARARALIEGCLELDPGNAKCVEHMERIERLAAGP